MQIAINNLGEPDSYINVHTPTRELATQSYPNSVSRYKVAKRDGSRGSSIDFTVSLPPSLHLSAPFYYSPYGEDTREGERGISRAETGPKNLCAGQGRGSEGIRVISDN